MKYLVSDYYATGEGRTVSILILKEATDEHAVAVFSKIFDSYLAMGVEVYEHEQFWKKFGSYMPTYVKNLIEDTLGPPPAFMYHSQLYLNFS